MIQKRFIITGLIQVGDYMRVILYPDDVVKKKKTYKLMDIALSGDVSQMQKDAVIDSIISGNPPTIYITAQEFLENDYRLGKHVVLTMEDEA